MEIEQSMALFIHTQKQKWLSMTVTLMVRLIQSVLQSYQTYKTFRKRFRVDYWFTHRSQH